MRVCPLGTPRFLPAECATAVPGYSQSAAWMRTARLWLSASRSHIPWCVGCACSSLACLAHAVGNRCVVQCWTRLSESVRLSTHSVQCRGLQSYHKELDAKHADAARPLHGGCLAAFKLTKSTSGSLSAGGITTGSAFPGGICVNLRGQITMSGHSRKLPAEAPMLVQCC